MRSRLITPEGRIGLFGGTFDPPHWGHIRTASAAADQLHLDQLAFLPAPHPPHKKNHKHTSYPLRKRMVELCLDLDPRFRICLIEEKDLPGTTLETILTLRKNGFTEDRCHLYWLMGSDSLLDLQHWHKPEEILKSVDVAVLPRPGFPASKASESFRRRVILLQTPEIAVSATDIRAGKEPLESLVPRPVAEFIRRHHLYRR